MENMYQKAVQIRNKVVTVTAKSKLQGANVAMYEDEGFAAQRYKITKLNDGYYKIQIINSGKDIRCICKD